MKDIVNHQKLIRSLVGKADSPSLKRHVEVKLGNKKTPSLTFKITNEIRRLNRPPKMPFRVGNYVKNLPECALIEETEGGSTHVFEKNTHAIYKKMLAEHGGKFSTLIYEELVDYAKKNAFAIEQSSLDECESVAMVNISEPIYRKEERMNLGHKITVFNLISSADPRIVHPEKATGTIATTGVTQNISQNGLKVKVAAPLKLDAFYVVFVEGVANEFALQQPLVVYQCKGVSNEERDGKTWFCCSMMKINNPAHKEFDKFIKAFINSHKGRYRVDLLNVEKAVTNRYVEQFLTNRSNAFSAFFDADGASVCLYGSAQSQPYIKFFASSEGGNVLFDLIKNDGLLSSRHSASLLWFGIKRRGQFYTSLLNRDDALTLDYFRYVVNDDEGFVYHVDITEKKDFNPFTKLAIPDDVVNVSRCEYGHHTKRVVESIDKVVTFTPIPCSVYAMLSCRMGDIKPNKRFNTFKSPCTPSRKVKVVFAQQKNDEERGGGFACLGDALRNLHNYSASSPEGVFHKRRSMGYVSHISAKPALLSLSGGDDEESLKRFLYSQSVKDALHQGLKDSCPESPYVYKILAIQSFKGRVDAVDCFDVEESSIVPISLKRKSAQRHQHDFKLLVMRVTKKAHVDDDVYSDELRYIQSVSSHRAERLCDAIAAVKGVVSFFPLCHDALWY